MKKPYWKKMMALNKRQRTSFISTFMLLLFSSCSLSLAARAEPDTTGVNHKNLRTLIIASGIGYTAGVATLNYVWYKDTERQSFRFFNDFAEWKQLDKAGHFFNAFYLSDIPSRAMRGCNVEGRKADLIGALSGFLLTLPIEVMDGFSDGYGASVGDLVADAAGPVFFLGQKLAWDEIRIIPKASFHRTDFPPLRPQLLGDNLLSEIVKDYNGQTYWFSIDVDKFMPFPKWLNLAVGYGAHEMVYARDSQNEAIGLHPYRQYYAALDFDLTAIKTRSKLVKTLLYVASTIRLPGPAVQFSTRGSRFYPFYF